jgi:5-methylcytosine-specific restriction endonuclease McrA
MPEQPAARKERYRRGLAIRCTCTHCGVEFSPKERTRTKYCSRECGHAAMRVPGNPIVAAIVVGRYKRSASARQRRADTDAAQRFRSVRFCGHCGITFVALGFRNCCTRECHRRYEATRVPAPYRHRATPRVGSCKQCSTEIVASGKRGRRRVFCSLACQKRWWSTRTPTYTESRREHEQRRRAQIRSLPTERFRDAEVFERDGWVCGLCGEPVARNEIAPHPQSASLDHIIPLARGGHHTRENTQCAHFGCNARKGARVA